MKWPIHTSSTFLNNVGPCCCLGHGASAAPQSAPAEEQRHFQQEVGADRRWLSRGRLATPISTPKKWWVAWHEWVPRRLRDDVDRGWGLDGVQQRGTALARQAQALGSISSMGGQEWT